MNPFDFPMSDSRAAGATFLQATLLAELSVDS
jgi:hypothetical protein